MLSIRDDELTFHDLLSHLLPWHAVRERGVMGRATWVGDSVIFALPSVALRAFLVVATMPRLW